MVVRLGDGSFLGFGVKQYATSGPVVAADIKTWLRVDEGFDNIQLERDRIEFNDLNDYDDTKAKNKAGQRRVSGTLSFKVPYAHIQDLLRFLTGHDVSPTGAGPYVYAFVPVRPGNAANVWSGTTLRSLVLEVHRGTVVQSTFYSKVIISEWTVTFEQNNYVTMQLTIMGGGRNHGTASVPVYAGDFAVTPTGQAGAFLTMDGVAYIVRSGLTISINSGLSARYGMTDIEPLTPYPTKKREVTISCEIEADLDKTWMDILDDPEGSSLGPVLVVLTQGSAGLLRQLSFSFIEAVLDNPAEPRAAGIGPVMVKLAIRAQTDGTTPSYTVSLTNGDAAYQAVLP